MDYVRIFYIYDSDISPSTIELKAEPKPYIL